MFLFQVLSCISAVIGKDDYVYNVLKIYQLSFTISKHELLSFNFGPLELRENKVNTYGSCLLAFRSSETRGLCPNEIPANSGQDDAFWVHGKSGLF